MKFFSIFICFLLSLSSVFAQNTVNTDLLTPEEKKTIIERIREVKNLPLDEYVEKMNLLEKDFLIEFVTKNSECKKVFIFYLINDEGEKVERKKRLNRKERKECYLKLVENKIEIVKEIHAARNYQLKILQDKQRESLHDMQKSEIQKLESMAKKYK